MPNARDADQIANHRILILGYTGNGKTTQFLTLPGKKYMYIFDPNALNSLQGHDVDYDTFMPDTVGAAVSSLSKSKASDASSAKSSDAYKIFEQQFNDRINSGFFQQYDWIGFDSATTLLDLIMDRVLTINGRYGTWPHEDDYGPQMIAFTNLCRTLTGMGKSIFMTGHLETRKDKLTQKVSTQPMMTGRLTQKIPLLFSDIFIATTDLDSNGKPSYKIQTVPDSEMRTVRTSIKGLEPFENVTLDFSKPMEGQGIGGILNWAAKNPTGVK